MGKKFACGSSAISEDTIEIQGDIMEELMEFILKEFPHVMIYLLFWLSGLNFEKIINFLLDQRKTNCNKGEEIEVLVYLKA